MAKWSLRRYDIQARVSVLLSALALVVLAGTAVSIIRPMNWAEKTIPYKKSTLRMPVIYATGFAGLALGAAGFGLGFSSAGQRRNDKPLHSWLGFFLGGTAITLSLILLFLFFKWGWAVPE